MPAPKRGQTSKNEDSKTTIKSWTPSTAPKTNINIKNNSNNFGFVPSGNNNKNANNNPNTRQNTAPPTGPHGWTPLTPQMMQNFVPAKPGTFNNPIEVNDSDSDDEIIDITPQSSNNLPMGANKGKKEAKHEVKNESQLREVVVPRCKRKREKRKIYLNQDMLDRINGTDENPYTSTDSVFMDVLPKMPKIEKDKMTHLTFDSVWCKNTMTIPSMFPKSQRFYDNENFLGLEKVIKFCSHLVYKLIFHSQKEKKKFTISQPPTAKSHKLTADHPNSS